MGLFKDFKEDFSQAVNEMMPGSDLLEKEDKAEDLVVNTLGEDVDVKSELSKLDGLLEQVKNDDDNEPQLVFSEAPVPTPAPITAPLDTPQEKPQENVIETEIPPIIKQEDSIPEIKPIIKSNDEEKKIMSDTMTDMTSKVAPIIEPKVNNMSANNMSIADETSVITAGTTLTGDLASDGSFDIQGTINGNITCNGKLVVTGNINGNSAASEFFADVAKVEGEVVSSGTVKIGAGSVIIGNISAASAVIAGAVKGDIDVQGPVVVDTSAVVMGNIKSRSVQINNGAVIEGFCSQSYSDVDVESLFAKSK